MKKINLEVDEQNCLEPISIGDLISDGAELGDTFKPQEGLITASKGNFVIRNGKPTRADKNWKCYLRQTGYDGWSGAIVGKPTDSECNVLANCVGYAQGRFCEIYNEITGYSGTNKYFYLNCNAGQFIERAKKTYPKLVIGNEPKPGAILVMSCSGKAGHVIIVERVNSDGSIYTSESAYGGKAFFNCTRSKGDGRWGMGEGYYEVGFIYNPVVKEEPTHEFKVGDHVLLNGPLYKNASTTTASGYATNKDTHITRYYAGGIHHYNTTGDLGWCDAESLTYLGDVEYKISIKQVEGGTISCNKTVAKEKDIIKVVATPNAGYKLVKLTCNGTEISNNKFTMPAKDVVITGEFAKITYKINCAECENGTLMTSKKEALPGETILITAKGNAGYILQLITSEDVEIKDDNTFIMPEKDVTISATFAPEENYNKLVKLILDFIKKIMELLFGK